MNYNNSIPYRNTYYTNNNQRGLVPWLVGGAIGYGIGVGTSRPNYYPAPPYPVYYPYPPVFIPYYRR